MATGLPLLPRVQHSCEPCVLGKQHRQPIPKTRTTSSTRTLELLHSDLCGPFPVKSITGSRYILTFIDDYTSYCWVFFLAAKSETFGVFRQFKALIEKQTQQQLSCLRTYRGGEYLSTEFTTYCKTHGIRRQLITAGTPQQNGVAERKNRHLCETMRTLLFDAGLPSYLWEEAVRTANYIANRSPHQALHRSTPYSRLTGKIPNLSHLRIFGSASYIHIQHRNKLEPKSKQLIHVGYDEQSKAYRSLDFDRCKIIISRDVLFNESRIGLPTQKYDSTTQDDIFGKFIEAPSNLEPPAHLPSLTPHPSSPLPTPAFPTSDPDNPIQSSPTHISPTRISSLAPLSPPSGHHIDLQPSSPAPIQRSSRFRKQSVRLDNYIILVIPDDHDICLVELYVEPPSEPLSLDAALQHPGWTAAMHDELLSIRKNHTYDLVKLPPGKRPISSKWVFKTKPGLNGSLPRLKARLVARGFQQCQGTDFDEVFAPVVKWSTIRTLAARSALKQHPIHHLDVRTAFLYGILEEEVYMDQPPGFIRHGQEHLVWKLNRALYGLRQSPRRWYERINSYLTSIGMTRSGSDYNMYHIGEGHNKIVLVVYVDDLFITGGNNRMVSWLKQQLKNEFDITDLGPVTRYLGVDFQQHNNGLFLLQQQYASEMLKEFGMDNSRLEHIPLPPGT
jgi:hypothetical protein